jgi:Flp pilus assembly protein TadG
MCFGEILMQGYRNKRLFGNISGNTTVIAAMACVPLLGSAGAAIDYIRDYHASTALRSAADNAVLTGTSVLMETSGDEVKALAAANSVFSSQMASAPALLTNTVAFTINAKKNGVSASGTATIDTTLLKVIGIKDLFILNPSGAEFTGAEAPVGGTSGDLEISLMLDVTGSMCSDNNGPCSSDPKLAALKSAAKGLIDTVVWTDQSVHTSKVSIVPFNTHVRVAPDGSGGGIMKSLTNLDPTWNGWYNNCLSGSGGIGPDGTPATWVCSSSAPAQAHGFKIIPCVTDRFYETSDNFDYTDDAPGGGRWMNAMDGTRSGFFHDSSDTPLTVGTGNSASDLLNGWNYDATGGCGITAESNSIMTLSNSKSALKGKIDGLQGMGSTGGPLGTAFSWFMLAPSWNSALSNAAQPYSKLALKNADGSKKLRKIAILMTDGAYNAGRGIVGTVTTATLDAAAVQMCSGMKAKGIEIYTVGYALNTLPVVDQASATSTLQSCGSDISHFYESIDAAKLQSDFKTIASEIVGAGSGIRLTM